MIISACPGDNLSTQRTTGHLSTGAAMIHYYGWLFLVKVNWMLFWEKSVAVYTAYSGWTDRSSRVFLCICAIE